MSSLLRRLSPNGELLLINLICFGPFAGMSVWELLRGRERATFDDRASLTVIGIELVCGVIAALILRARGWKWSDFELPTTVRAALLQAIGGMLLYIGATLIIATIYQLYVAASGIDLSKVVEVQTRVSWPVLLLVTLINPLYEELFEVAYNLRAAAAHGAAFAISMSAAIRFACHLYQGPIAAVTILPLGLIFALVYWRWRKLWPLVVAHGAADVFALMPE